MTVSTTTNRYSYSGNGTTTAFAYSSKFLANADLVVVLVTTATGVGVVQTITTHYTVTGAGDANGGTVTMVTAPASTETLVIYGDPAATQGVDLIDGDDLAVDTQVETPLDRLTLLVQRLASRISRTFRLKDEDASTATLTLNTVSSAGKFLRMNTGGTALEFADGESSSDTYTPSGTGAISRTVVSKLGEIVSVKDFGAVGDGSTNDTAAIQAAIDAAGANSNVFFPEGTYKVTSTITVGNHRVHLWGAGTHATQILFAPTAADVCLQIRIAASSTYQGSIRDITFWSNDSTYAKTAIDLEDVSTYDIENVVIGGTVAFASKGLWRDTATEASTGIHIHGRDSTTFRNVTIFADKPIRISPNPNGAIEISADHFNFHNMYCGAANNPHVTIDSGCVLTQISFTGYQAYVGGDGFLYWVDATSPGSSIGLTFNNIRFENPDDATKYFMHIDNTSGVQGVRIVGGQTGGLNGFYLRNVAFMSFNSFVFSLTGYEGVNANATVTEMEFESCFWQSGTTSTLTGIHLSNFKPPYLVGGLPRTGRIIVDNATGGSYDEVIEETISAKEVTLAADEKYVIGASTQTGFVMITTRDNVTALYTVDGPAASTQEISDWANFFSGTLGSADQFNVAWDSGQSMYVVENGYATSKTLRVMRFGRAQ